MTMTDAEIEAALEKATPGPWYRPDGEDVWNNVSDIETPLPGRRICELAKQAMYDRSSPDQWWRQNQHNATLIAMAPSLARRALDRGKEIERLRAALREIIHRHTDIKNAPPLAPHMDDEDLALQAGLEQGWLGAAQIAAKAMEGKDD